MKKVSLKEIAKLAGVSSSTVSLILNGKAREMRISTTLEKKVTSMAKKAGYHPNQLAISLRTGKSHILGLVVESISGHFFAALAKVIEDEAERFGYRVLYCSTENDPKKGGELIRMLTQRKVDGFLVTPTKGMENDIRKLYEDKQPLVLIDSFFPNLKVPAVMVDNYEGVTEAMNHLIAKGHKQIAFITIDIPLEQLKLREKGFKDALKKIKAKPSRPLILRVPFNCTKEESISLITGFIKKHTEIDAIFFATNYLGVAGLESIRKAGLKIPGDIAMVSFDDVDLFRLYPPGISAVQQPVEKIAKTAMELLMKQILTKKNLPNPAPVSIAPLFIERGSSN